MTLDIVRHLRAEGFLGRAESWLLEAGAENHLMHSIASSLRGRPDRYGPEPPWLLTVERDGRIVAAALMTPPYKTILTSASDEAVAGVAAFYADEGAPVPGVLAPTAVALAFARRWQALTGRAFGKGTEQRLHGCDRVREPRWAEGRLRPAIEGDMDLLAQWYDGFRDDVQVQIVGSSRQTVEEHTALGRLHVWEGPGGPVSMASWSGATEEAARISLVYTPPENRCRGYASSCVGALTAKLLASGKGWCFLYTDLANPTSNKIYRAVGYEPVQDWVDYFFDA